MSSSVKRRTVACALCRKRKIKCDAKAWPCDACRKAGQPCVGGDTGRNTTNAEEPRSLVTWLRGEISRLEKAQTSEGASSAVPESKPPTKTPTLPQPVAGLPLGQVVSQDIAFHTLGISRELPLPQFILSDARLPSTEESQLGAAIGLTSSPSNASYLQGNPLSSIPKQVADFLLENYISRAMSSYPIFYEPWLRSAHASVFSGSPDVGNANGDGTEGPNIYDMFVIGLVMAVSLSSAARTKQAQANDMASKLCKQAIAHIKDVLTNDFAGLQALILLHTYAIMNPAVANVYFMAGYIMQACIDQGLHRETGVSDNIDNTDFLVQDIKRRVFWTAWELDVSCSSGFARPVTLQPEDISTGFPSDLEDKAIHASCIDQRGRHSKFINGRVRGFRLIEVEVISVLHHERPIPKDFHSLEEWMCDVDIRIQAWRDDIYRDASANQDISLHMMWNEMVLFADIATALIISILFRPCPRMQYPKAQNSVRAFQASTQVVEGYLKQANQGFGSPKYTFQPCHHVFSCARVFLHTAREYPSELAAIYTLEDIEGFIAAFNLFFDLTAERWPAVSRCRDEYQHLVERSKKYYLRALTVDAPCMNLDNDQDEASHISPLSFMFMQESMDSADLFLEPFTDPMVEDFWPDRYCTASDWDAYFDIGLL